MAEQRGKIIKLLETAMTLAEDVEDGTTAYLIERALDEAPAGFHAEVLGRVLINSASALPQKAGILCGDLHVRLGPQADIKPLGLLLTAGPFAGLGLQFFQVPPGP